MTVLRNTHVITVMGGLSRMENEDYAVQETPNRKGRDWNSKNFQVLVYGDCKRQQQ